MMMGCSSAPEESYERLGRRRRPAAAGFRLCPRNRFSVRRLRARLRAFAGLLGRCVRLLARRLSSAGGGGGFPRSGGSRRALVAGTERRPAAAAGKASPATFIRSNSFYAQAIAECLEFIKRNSVPVEEYGGAGAGRGRH